MDRRRNARLRTKAGLITLVLLTVITCGKAPVLPEAELAKKLEQHLWEAGAPVFIPGDYEIFCNALRIARILEIQAKDRFFLGQKMNRVREEYQKLIERGENLLQIIEEKKRQQESSLTSKLQELEEIIFRLRTISSAINGSHGIRQRVIKAELLMAEAQREIEKQKFKEAEQAISSARQQASSAKQIVLSLFARYINEGYLSLWQKMAQEAIDESKKINCLAIIVDKLEKKLFVYSGGKKSAVYNVGLGRFSLADKLHAGDEATPEGKYKIIKKILNSQYYKALLLDYPNEIDRQRFAEMKKKGLIPPEVGIGGLIEIHGGGQDGLTYGCIAMDNEAIDELFRLVEIGTPVTIVGTLNRELAVLKLVRELLF